MFDAITEFRAFNRFHTHLVGALDEKLLDSELTLPQARVLYEVANSTRSAPVSAADLSAQLRLDPGYLSRIITALEVRGLLVRVNDPEHGKRLLLALTPEGSTVYQSLNAATVAEMSTLLGPMTEADRRSLIDSMRTIRRLLGDKMGEPRPVIIRSPRPGDLGHVISRQASVYTEEYGWDWTYEGLVADIIGQFVKTYDPAFERAWIAERDGEVVGSVFVVKVDTATAKLRLLYVDKAARGAGLGRRLVEECLAFAKSAGYRRMELWTNDCLTAARRIYEATGFNLDREEAHHSFGKDLMGQYWSRDL
jgi:DNA-binding MarR family transcriptional regulator/GNAT superfamily N-acetyltransferase